MYIEDTQFKGVTPVPDAKTVSLTDETLGAHIYVIVDAYLFIKDCYFLEGVAKQGGALFVEGNATVEIFKTTFQSNYARRKGGAIYGTGFNKIRIAGRSKLLYNLAMEQGDDIYAANTEGVLELDQVQFNNQKAAGVIYAENVNVSLSGVDMADIGVSPHRPLTYGAGLQCYDCRALLLQSSTFSNLHNL